VDVCGSPFEEGAGLFGAWPLCPPARWALTSPSLDSLVHPLERGGGREVIICFWLFLALFVACGSLSHFLLCFIGCFRFFLYLFLFLLVFAVFIFLSFISIVLFVFVVGLVFILLCVHVSFVLSSCLFHCCCCAFSL